MRRNFPVTRPQVLLRLANFPGGRRCALVKIGALLRVAVSQIYGAGRGPLVKSRPRSSCAWPIFAARGGARLRKPERCAKHSSLFHPQDAVAVFAPAPLRLFLPQAAPQLRSQLRLASSAAGGASAVLPPSLYWKLGLRPRPHSGCMVGFTLFHRIAPGEN